MSKPKRNEAKRFLCPVKMEWGANYLTPNEIKQVVEEIQKERS